MTYSALIFFAVLAIDLWTDLRRHFAGKEINHTRGLILRIAGLAPSVLLLSHDRLLGAFVEGILFMTLFNGVWGIATGNGWFYFGHTAAIDKLMNKLKPASYIFQYAALIALIWQYFGQG